MNTKRIFVACIFTALLAAAASAQSNDRRAQWQKYFRHTATAARAQSPSAEAEMQMDEPQIDGTVPQSAG